MVSYFSVKVRPSPLLIVLVVCLSLWLSTSSMALAAGSVKGVSPARSYAFTVNTTHDTHDAHPGAGRCADKNGNCSLRAAIEEADALPKGSQISITVPAGIYRVTLGTLGLTANTITITGAGSKTTVIKSNYTFGIMRIASRVAAALSQLTLSGGKGRSGGGIDNLGMLRVSNSTLSGNLATNNGGGIENGFNGLLSVSNSNLSGNTAANNGGGIENGFNGTLSVSNSTLSGNTAANNGGGIENDIHGLLSVSNSNLSGNSAGSYALGGGIDNSGTATIATSTLSGNTATNGYGGGIVNKVYSTLSVSNSTFSSNWAYAGGGIYNGGTLSVSTSTFSGNLASFGEGIYSHGRVTLTATIIANSPVGSNCHGPITDGGYNLDSGISCGFNLKTDLNKTDPKLGPLRNNGGPTPTMALLQGSKAIDWVALSSCPSTDQRGYTRPDDQSEHARDIGAYESAYEISKGG